MGRARAIVWFGNLGLATFGLGNLWFGNGTFGNRFNFNNHHLIQELHCFTITKHARHISTLDDQLGVKQMQAD